MIRFLESELSQLELSEGLFEVIPVPFEESVSYGKGTARGPEAILEASNQLERWSSSGMPGDAGIVTSPPVKAASAQQMVREVENRSLKVLRAERIPVLIGGEHTVSVGAFRSLNTLMQSSTAEGKLRDIGIIQIDAHADLRDSYEGSTLSHACVMKRALDLDLAIYQLGVRSLSHEEVLLRQALVSKQPERFSFLDASEAVRHNITQIRLPELFPREVYLTIDIDGLDPSIFPSTGTPEPGGLGWYQTLDLVASIAKERRVIGFDLVELAPVPERHADPFAAARLIHEVMGIILDSPSHSRAL
jgi:agmatinase